MPLLLARTVMTKGHHEFFQIMVSTSQVVTTRGLLNSFENKKKLSSN